MKLILNEQQFRMLVKEELMENQVLELLNEGASMTDIIKRIKQVLLSGVAAATIITAIQRANLSDSEKSQLIDNVNKTEMAINGEKQEEKEDNNFKERVRECEKYMEFALKNQGYSLASTKLKPETLVRVADETGFDLPFLMAAANQESCFGATNRAQRTNSVFSVGSYDDGRDVVTYSDPNDSVAGYVDLLKRRYLVNGKTIFDFMVPGKFVDKDGHRYAKDPKYETNLKSIRNRILKMYPALGKKG